MMGLYFCLVSRICRLGNWRWSGFLLSYRQGLAWRTPGLRFSLAIGAARACGSG